MSSTGWADALLVVVLLAPLAAVVLASAGTAPSDQQRWTTGACSIAAVGAVVLLVAGQHPHASRLAPDDVALAAVAATAALAVGVRTFDRTPVLAGAVTVMTCGIASGVPGRPSTVGPVLALAAVTALFAVTRQVARLTLMVLSVGSVATAAGVRVGGHGGEAAVVVGAALVAVVASRSTRSVVTVLVPLALLLGLRVGPGLVGTSTARWLAVVLAVAGVGLALLPAVVPRCASLAVGLPLVPWTLAAAVGPLSGTPSAARALAAGTVIALALGGSMAVLAAVPGAAVFCHAVADGHGWPRVVLAVLVFATVFGLAGGASGADAARLRVVDVVVLAAGAWFVLRPTSWTWVRVGELRAYSDGTVLAIGAALLTGAVLTMTGARLTVGPVAPWIVGGDERTQPVPARVHAALVASAVLTGLIAAALVRSARI